ncbi:hypothetical protein H6F93_12105 [Leptolyngbya sp. FACHB-671]|uniref:TIGR02391 family protein n=1 Tax=Leptolyngbya sp. FACHB-671 TaxID=2692812 RepID=UPI00168601DA|nr:TIGR02391 family protein [Leptolyngbya sp. FACHB-671]MBD2068255.1 hypothetical protein [Leptolyngbya sp. FACHB-671]
MYNLTNQQKDLVRWLVQKIQEGKLNEEFGVMWVSSLGSLPPKALMRDFRETDEELSGISITQGALNVLAENKLIHCDIVYKIDKSGKQNETARRCTVMGKAYEAVDADFNAPDTSFITHLTPLADISNFDEQLKKRCLPILGAGSSDSMLWDSAVRTAGVILEERLRDVGSISNPNCTGSALVNNVFSDKGTLASKFTVASERQGYRDLYAGIVGTFRNPSAHRLIDPSPEEGGAFIVFVNLLLSKLEALK